MMGPTITRLLVFCLIAAASAVCLAQGKTSPNADRRKGSCDFITQAEVEAILGTAVQGDIPPIAATPGLPSLTH